MSTFWRGISLFWMLGLAICLPGCGRSDGRIEVRGTATFNGEPIADGYVELQPTDGQGQVAGAEIVDGKFTVAAFPSSGRVSVRAHRQIGMTEPTERIPTPEPILFQFLPPEFNSNSGLTYTIEAGNPTLALELNGEELSPSEKLTPDEQRRRAMQGGQGG
jgi:hypothetical protein